MTELHRRQAADLMDKLPSLKGSDHDFLLMAQETLDDGVPLEQDDADQLLELWERHF